MEDVIEKYERQKEPSTHIVLKNSQMKLYFWKINLFKMTYIMPSRYSSMFIHQFFAICSSILAPL